MQEQTTHQTPHLKTMLTGPMQMLEQRILSEEARIEAWFQSEWRKTAAPVYGSVDLRNAGFKLAPVDMNLFPAGFNNLKLNPAFFDLSVNAARQVIQQAMSGASKVLLIPENHTRNLYYWENVQALISILEAAGMELKVGSLSPDLTNPKEIQVNNRSILLEPLKREGNRLALEGFQADVILLNNDLSEGIPQLLLNLEQPVLPPAELGWYQRLKSAHFGFYESVTNEFAKLIDIDPWLIAPLFEQCGEINFMQREGESCLAEHVGTLLESIQKKYAEYGIPQTPYVVVKADAGTYGMAVMMVKSVDEVLNMNRKQRTHMSKSKGGQEVTSVIVQEGVYTFETWGPSDAVAEPVVYLWGERVVGGFYRVHKERGIDENLNSPGMHFEPLAFVKSCQEPLKQAAPGECQNRFYAYGVIARLSMLAAAREIQKEIA